MKRTIVLFALFLLALNARADVSATETVSDWGSFKSALESGKSVQLAASFIAPRGKTVNLPLGVDVVIDLNGETLLLAGEGPLMNIPVGGRVCVRSSPSASRVGDVAGVNEVDGYFATVYGTLTLESGEITGFHVTPVEVGNVGTFEMTGGTITSCHTDTGGAVRVLGKGSFIMRGGTISRCSSLYGGGVLVEQGGTFRLCGGTIRDCEAGFGGGVFVKEGGNASLQSGTIASCNGYGGGVGTAGSVTMDGGSIVTCKGEGAGGGVQVKGSGTFRLAGGKIADNSAWELGGGVRTEGLFEMTGGEISGNRVTDEPKLWSIVGGGVSVGKGGTFKFSSGTVAGNAAPNGGGVSVNSGGTLAMSGGILSNNTAMCWGGGVGVERGGLFTLSGGEIVGNATANTVDGLGGGVHSSGGFTMTEGIVRDNVGYSGAQLYLNVDAGKSISGGVVHGAIHSENNCLSVCGGVFDAAPSSVLGGYESIAVVGYHVVALAGTSAQARGILTAGQFRFDPIDVKYVSLGIVAPQNFYSAVVAANPKVWQLKSKKAIDCETWSEVRDNLSAGNDVVLSNNVTVEPDGGAVTVPTGRQQTMDLGGHVITSKFAKALFDLKTANASLTVGGSGRIVNAATDEAGHDGGCFDVTAGSLEIAGGTYEGFRVGNGCNGGCVHVGQGASFVLTDGVISNCWAGGAGGAVASEGTCVIAGGLLTRNGSALPGGAVTALNGEMLVSGGEFAANGGSAPANGAALAAVDNAKLTLTGGWFHDNVTATQNETAGTGAAVYLMLRPAGSAQILGGLFGANRMGGYDEISNVLVDRFLKGDAIMVTGGFFFRQNPTTLSEFVSAEYESVPVRTDWWVIGLRDTVQIANNRVNEGTFTFDLMGEPCYVMEDLVSGAARTLYTPASAGHLATWQLTSVAVETLAFECRCVLEDGTVPTGLHLVRTYLTTEDGSRTSETNLVAVQLDPNGYYASQTSLDTCGFFERYGEAYLAIDVCTADGETVIRREPRQKIGFVPYALHASQAESLKRSSQTAEELTLSNSARVGTLTASASLTVTQSAVVTNEVTDIAGKVTKMTIDRLNLSGAGSAFLEPIGGMSLGSDAHTGWMRVASSATGRLNARDGQVAQVVSCPYDGLLFISCATTDGGALDLRVTRSGDVGQEEVFSRDGIVAADGTGYDLSTVVVRGDRVTVSARATGEGSATVAYRYVTFGASREEK